MAADRDGGHGSGSARLEQDLRDDLPRLAALRAEADRLYNDALTRLDGAIQQLPADFPHPPPGPDEQQITPLNHLWKIDAPSAAGGLKRRFVAAVRQAMAPLVEQQQAFNSALVDHINRNVPIDRQTRESIDSTLAVVRDATRGADSLSKPAGRVSSSRSRPTSTPAIGTSPVCCAGCPGRSTPSRTN